MIWILNAVLLMQWKTMGVKFILSDELHMEHIIDIKHVDQLVFPDCYDRGYVFKK